VETALQSETTALGAAYVAGIHAGLWKGKEDVAKTWRRSRTFSPVMEGNVREVSMARWRKAVETTRCFKSFQDTKIQ
jgi:glycerol kinase